MLTASEISKAKSRLCMATVSALIDNDWDVVKATPELVAEVHGDKAMLTALLHEAIIVNPFTAVYHDEMPSMDLVHSYATKLAAKWNERSERVEVGND